MLDYGLSRAGFFARPSILAGGVVVLAVPFLACMALVSSIYHLPQRVLPSIQAVEGGALGSVHRNSNGSSDIGLMQINTIWTPALSRYTGLSESVVQARLLNWPCFNIAAAGAILRTYVGEAHGDLMIGIGYYHSHTITMGRTYSLQVQNAARRLFESR